MQGMTGESRIQTFNGSGERLLSVWSRFVQFVHHESDHTHWYSYHWPSSSAPGWLKPMRSISSFSPEG
jgi:hypothetical protein